MTDEDRRQRTDDAEERPVQRRRPRQEPGPQREPRRDPDAAPRRARDEGAGEERSERRAPRSRSEEDGAAERRPSPDHHEDRDRGRAGGRRRLDAIAASERAVDGLQRLTRRPVEGVVAIAPEEDGAFTVTVEVLELERVPSTADVLAEYEVRLDPDGRLLSYRRGDRYARGSTRSE